MKFIQILLNLLSTGALIILGIIGLISLASNTSLFGTYKSFLVQSGSMEPSIMTGDIIIIKDSAQYNVNDTVTFKTNDERIVTHRIVKIHSDNDTHTFTTKGDANRSEDADIIDESQIIGKVQFIIPKLGFLVVFSRTLPGLLFLLLLPVMAVVADQLIKD